MKISFWTLSLLREGIWKDNFTKAVLLVPAILSMWGCFSSVVADSLPISISGSCLRDDGSEVFSLIGKGERESIHDRFGTRINDSIEYTHRGVKSSLRTRGLLVNRDMLKIEGMTDLLMGFSPPAELYLEYIPVNEETRSPIQTTIMNRSVEIEWHFEKVTLDGCVTMRGPFIVKFADTGLIGVGTAERTVKGDEMVSSRSTWYVKVPRKVVDINEKIFQYHPNVDVSYQYLLYTCDVKCGAAVITKLPKTQ